MIIVGNIPMNKTINLPILYTSESGQALFHDACVALESINEMLNLSTVLQATGFQLRKSPQGMQKGFHCTERKDCQMVLVLTGIMQIGLRNGTSRSFNPGEYFLSMDFLPEGQAFDDTLHGHSTKETSEGSPLSTIFIKVPTAQADILLTI